MKILEELEIQDVTCIDQDVKTKLLDEDRLGACKIEKYVIRGIALGAKQYAVYYLEKNLKNGIFTLKQATKIKGVREDARSYNLLLSINNNIGNLSKDLRDLDIGELPIILTKAMTKWSRMGAGAILSEVRKLVRPTLTKRRHDVLQGTSRPFKDLTAFLNNKVEYEQVAKEMKQLYKADNEVQTILKMV